MPPPKRDVQKIRLNNVVEMVEVKEKDGKKYVLLDDVKDIFGNAKRLVYDRISVPFMTDENEK
ncbi:hypothetical protein BGX34_002662, partial [Mortierella sp. NVP85]